MRGRLRRVALLLTVTGLTACNSLLGPKTPDANWVTHTRGHFTFYVRSGSFAERSIDTLDAVLNDEFTHVTRRLGLRYDGHIAMFLHNTGDDAGFGSDGDGGNRSGVAYPSTETVKTVAVPPLDGGLFNLLQHESNHVINSNGLGRHGTTFMNEGLASAVISEAFHANGPTFYHHWANVNRSRLPRMTALVIDDEWRATNAQVAYNASASFLAWLLDTHGAAKLRAMWPVGSADFASTFQTTYGFTLEEAEARWLAFCDGR